MYWQPMNAVIITGKLLRLVLATGRAEAIKNIVIYVLKTVATNSIFAQT
jgi:hypothetical protein